MLSDAHQTKLLIHHSALDWAGSGYVTKSDFEQIAANFAALRGADPGSELADELLEKFRFVWATYWEPSDANADGRVSPDEFVAGITAAVEAGVRSDDQLLPLLYDMIDTEGVGSITPEQHRAFFEAFRIDGDKSPATFAAMDVDGDGVVSQAEFLDAGAKFFFYDEDSPGNVFWG